MKSHLRRNDPNASTTVSGATTMSEVEDKDIVTLCFQDVIKEYIGMEQEQPFKRSKVEEVEEEEERNDMVDVANVFFELANASQISYRMDPLPSSDQSSPSDNDERFEEEEGGPNIEKKKKKKSKKDSIVIQQDTSACLQHTGGIVWETAYLLLNYLRHTNLKCKTFLEVGAGCGLVGLGVWKAPEVAISRSVTLTETIPVMDNLQINVDRNNGQKNEKDKSKQKKSEKKNYSRDNDCALNVSSLDWNYFERDCANAEIEPHSMDVIAGTDVVFTPGLVEPLLQTLQYLSHSKTTVYLCLQERCKDSHALLLEKASTYSFEITNITKQLATVPACCWGVDLDCCLLRFTVTEDEKRKKTKRRRRKVARSEQNLSKIQDMCRIK